MTDRPRALVYRAIGLGDLLTGVPALRALRRALPDHEIVLAAPAWQWPLLQLADCVDRLAHTEELHAPPWHGRPPEVAVDLHGNGPASRDLLAALGPGRLVAFETPDGPRWDPAEHERARWCRLVEHAFGVKGDPDDVRLREPDRKPCISGAAVLHAGAASASRRWPVERWADLARALDPRAPIALTGSVTERRLTEQVRRGADLPLDCDLAGRTDARDLAALVASARLVVSGDTGTAHLAAAYGVPSVVLFGPTPPSRWGPPPGPHVVLWHGDEARPGDPHGDEPDPALLRITPAEVMAAVEDLLDAPAWRRRLSPAAPPSSARSA